MRFDTADVTNFVNTNRFQGVVRHEMGHVLGIGTLWGNPATAGVGSLCRQPGDNTADPFYVCPLARAAFDSIGGGNYTGGTCGGTPANKVPIEGNSQPSGTRDGHWRECVFDEELMTGFAEAIGVATPISIVSIGSLEDHGHGVNYGAREFYVQPFNVLQSPAASRAGGFPMNDIMAAPIVWLDSRGRVVGVQLPR
jgi:hypothetical protein